MTTFPGIVSAIYCPKRLFFFRIVAKISPPWSVVTHMGPGYAPINREAICVLSPVIDPRLIHSGQDNINNHTAR